MSREGYYSSKKHVKHTVESPSTLISPCVESINTTISVKVTSEGQYFSCFDVDLVYFFFGPLKDSEGRRQNRYCEAVVS